MYAIFQMYSITRIASTNNNKDYIMTNPNKDNVIPKEIFKPGTFISVKGIKCDSLVTCAVILNEQMPGGIRDHIEAAFAAFNMETGEEYLRVICIPISEVEAIVLPPDTEYMS
jgi:hypothetical protein